MSKMKLKDKIKNLVKKLNINESAENYIFNLIDISENGVVYRDKLSSVPYTPSTPIDISELRENGLITYNSSEQTLFLNPYNDIIYYRLAAERKRRYLKTNATPLLNHSKINGILFKNEDAKGIEYTTKINGFKVPVYFRPYLTSEPISELNIKNLMKSDPRLLELEQKRRNLNKEDKTVLCGCMSFCINGVIRDINRYNLCKSMRNSYNLRSFSQSTLNLCIKKLISVGLLSEYIDTIDGSNCLRICGYKEAFDKHEHYIIVPDCIFKKDFKRLQASCIKLFYDILFKLNNGEDNKDHYLGQKKAIYMKFKKDATDSIESKQKYNTQNIWLKKRYPGELRDILFGSINDKDYLALAEFFHFTKPNKDMDKENVLQVRIRKEYFISKKTELFKPLLNLMKKDKEKFDAIEKELKDKKLDLTDREIIGIIKLLKNENIKVIKHLLQKLVDRIAKSRNEGWQEIENVVGYMAMIYKNLEPIWD